MISFYVLIFLFILLFIFASLSLLKRRFVQLEEIILSLVSNVFSDESGDANNRLQAVRQRVVELERNISNLQMTCDKYQQVKPI